MLELVLRLFGLFALGFCLEVVLRWVGSSFILVRNGISIFERPDNPMTGHKMFSIAGIVLFYGVCAGVLFGLYVTYALPVRWWDTVVVIATMTYLTTKGHQ